MAVLEAVVVAFNQIRSHQPDVVSRGGGVGAIVSESLENWAATYGKSVDDMYNFREALPLGVRHMLSDYIRYTKYLA